MPPAFRAVHRRRPSRVSTRSTKRKASRTYYLATAIALSAIGMAAAVVGETCMRLEVVGPSMEPALSNGDRLLVNRVVYRLRRPREGEIVAAEFASVPGRLVIKRVGRVTHGGRFFLAGDNPQQSTDSRQLGAADRRAVTGRVWFRYWPPSRRGMMPATRPSAG